MAEQQNRNAPKAGITEKPERDVGKGTQTSGSKGQEHDHGVKSGGAVGRDEPDQSKEKNTEIAVEAGRKGGERRDEPR
jgi:general stress protein YciG